jgi:hypothetical protein
VGARVPVAHLPIVVMAPGMRSFRRIEARSSVDGTVTLFPEPACT